MGVLTHRWSAIGTDNTVTVTAPASIVAAVRLAEQHIARLDEAASRFRGDSELSLLTERGRRGVVTVTVSPVLGYCIEAALHAARLTGGIVDPTVGGAVAEAGYDADLAEVRSRRPETGRARESVHRVDWRQIDYRPRERRLTIPAGTRFDLGATAKAAAADAIARELAGSLPGGFLVNLGGDIAVSGVPPDGGWPIAVEDHRGNRLQVIRGNGQAFATSSTGKRTWMHRGRRRHHIIDPRTGAPARTAWSQVTCAGVSAVEANAASTAAIVLGPAAPEWLAAHGIPARLDHVSGGVVATPGWPAIVAAVAA
jgi:thiamine biosynthesis lipoprotein